MDLMDQVVGRGSGNFECLPVSSQVPIRTNYEFFIIPFVV